jgi:uncharacterized protein (DUF1810 family)
VADAPYRLERFVAAQQESYTRALAEIRAGAKQSHWMWFIFPQIAGLGTSATARHYAIGSLAEARAYLAHPLLGPRLRECVVALGSLPPQPEKAFGPVDAMKLRSSLTLFAEAAADEPVFQATLHRWFGADGADTRTLRLLNGAGKASF